MRRPTRKGGIMPISTTRTGQSDLDSSSRNVPAASPHTQSINRRHLIVRGGAIAAAAAAFPAPAIAQGVRELKMVTSWPKGLPGLGTSAERLGCSITEITRGRLKVQVFGAGELVSAFEAFDAVSSGVADMYHATDYYWEKKSPAYSFFTAVPFGFTADEMAAWIHFGGGQQLWDELG